MTAGQQWRSLTVYQQKVLIRLGEPPRKGHYYASYYPPIRKLIGLSLITGDGAGIYRLTQAGLDVLAAGTPSQ